MALECLERYSGSTVIHAGELFGDTTMVDKAPWGRTSAPEFQQRLFSEYRCAPCESPRACVMPSPDALYQVACSCRVVCRRSHGSCVVLHTLLTTCTP